MESALPLPDASAIFTKAADGTGEALPLMENGYGDAWSPDGGAFLFKRGARNNNWDIGVLWLQDDREPEILLGTPFNELEASFSPDGRFLAYVSDESGQRQVYLHPFPGLEGRWQISTDGGDEPRFSPDGGEIFYRSGDRMMAVSFSTEPRVSVSQPRVLFEGRYEVDPFNNDAHNYDLTPDGRHFVMVQRSGEGSDQIHVVVNWMEELKRMDTGE